MTSILEISIRRMAPLACGTLGFGLTVELINCFSPDVLERAKKLEQLIDCLLGAYSTDGIKAWFARPRSQLDGQTPANAWLRGEHDKVLELGLSLQAGNCT